MEKTRTNHIAIVGVGNIIRSDDGLGSFVCCMIEELDVPGVKTLTVHQLNTDIIEELLAYKHVLIVDASLYGDDAALHLVEKDEMQVLSSSHHMNADMLKALAVKIYGRNLSIYSCAIKGVNFETGDLLSETAISNAYKALQLIKNWIRAMQ
ncbi:hydrogenase maturation protease [Chitinophagaceae bacterium LB-8]|uniref:Hydrogenase maturation protease n=1 Tax=Paraflavisolibacter caeni TaxID=2982496 RepID=A0A9X2XVG2_9BACT|nr:hydrogenase maturation protease [Paraflavisolibacter caeni]MCU7549137.1 hydrogenase maturation protease [Paraflavisolibacter caeni]